MKLKVKPDLTEDEVELIRKIAKIHLQVLDKILNDDMMSGSIELQCYKVGVNQEALKSAVLKQRKRIKRILKEPFRFFWLKGHNESTATTILMNFFEHPVYESARRSIFRKLQWIQPLPKEVEFSLN